jgi:hypothetical protein
VPGSIEYTGGDFDNFGKRSGGYSNDVREMPLVFTGDDCCGAGPDGQTGMCLLGIGVGVRGRTLRLNAGDTGGGVAECRKDCCWTRTVAMAVMSSVGCSSQDIVFRNQDPRDQRYATRSRCESHPLASRRRDLNRFQQGATSATFLR